MKHVAGVVLVFASLCSALDPADAYHTATSIFYVNPTVGEIKLRVKKNCANEVYAVLNAQRLVMDIGFRSENYDYFVAHSNPFDSAATYYFVLKDTVDTLVFPSTELHPAVAPFRTPVWAQGKTYYSIFIDGFFNGNTANDPADKLVWGTPSQAWRSYGGDLEGILQQCAYIDSLNPDIILLGPICASSSNHKFNPRDVTVVDPQFGDTVILKNLIDEIHARNKRIILSLAITHTGTDSPSFTNVIAHGKDSPYAAWYLLKAQTVKMAPPNYECWRSDARFPKLNVRNTDVENLLIGCLEYWMHFGFDGLYIGEDEEIEPLFVAAARNRLKDTFPDCLLLGCDPRLLSGQGFDGCCNRSIRQTIIDYFVKNSMTTSEFDQTMRKIYFFNPPQANSVNFISLSDYDARICRTADPELLEIMYAFIFTCIGSPCILSGDEIGVSACAPLCPGCCVWNPQAQNRSLLDKIKRLIEIRKSYPQLAGTTFYTLYADDIFKVYAYDRGGITVVLNSGDKASFVEIPAWDGHYSDVMSGETFIAYAQRLKLTINPKSYRILKREV